MIIVGIPRSAQSAPATQPISQNRMPRRLEASTDSWTRLVPAMAR